jgi:D-alanyl-D-alanine carboxypeptidase (penicillin-binding protein 5/6)
MLKNIRTFCLLVVLLLPSVAVFALQIQSRDPYAGAIVVDYEHGKVVFEDRADVRAYPASMVKLMNLYIVMKHLELGLIALDDEVKITREVAMIGGRQVWLAENEVFPLRELIYAMMVHSANDAATAIALHVAGSKREFVKLMNAKACEFEMSATEFRSVHGLPPGNGQMADMSSARDFARLARRLLRDYPQVLKYTSVKTRPFRKEKPVTLTSPNKLISTVDGCDGLKTGYFRAAGFSITATAQRNGKRVIVVIGAKSKTVRNRKAAEFLELGLKER